MWHFTPSGIAKGYPSKRDKVVRRSLWLRPKDFAILKDWL